MTRGWVSLSPAFSLEQCTTVHDFLVEPALILQVYLGQYQYE